AQTEINTAEVCAALERVASDWNLAIRDEALNGLAKRAPETALTLVRNALLGDSATLALFEAAERLADTSLAGVLKELWLSESGDRQLDEAARAAFAACSTENDG
ncbi:MAG: lyase, partial [Parvularculaceae bacterium]|nr:lyase [Parvularculaceae bacterium]